MRMARIIRVFNRLIKWPLDMIWSIFSMPNRNRKLRNQLDLEIQRLSERSKISYLEVRRSIDLLNRLQKYERMLRKSDESLFTNETPGSLVLKLELPEDIAVDTDEVVQELSELCRALNAYYIACGGTGLIIDDGELLVPSRTSVGV